MSSTTTSLELPKKLSSEERALFFCYLHWVLFSLVGKFLLVGGLCSFCGMFVVEVTVRVNEKGRVIIPKRIRRSVNLKEGSCVSLKTHGRTIIFEAAEPVSDRYRGAFKVKKWSKDMDESVEGAMKKWWSSRST